MRIDFRGYLADCLLRGQLELAAPRLTDQLNETVLLRLHDVTLEGLADGGKLHVATYVLHRDDLLAAQASGPRGSTALRIATVRRRLQVQLGPYTVLGRLHSPPGVPAADDLARRGPMVPLTDATIAYLIGGILEVRDAATIIVNHDLASWLRGPDGDDPGEAAALAGEKDAPGPDEADLVPASLQRREGSS
jgi:hypothetical protein